MRDGQTLSPNQGETITCIRSSRDGGRFEFAFTLEGKHDAPPLHAHEDPEEIVVDAGRLEIDLDGERKVLEAGERFVIPAGTFHTFHNRSEPGALMRAHGTHNAFFEHLLDQFDEGGGFLRLAVTICSPEGRRSYRLKPLVRGAIEVAAFVGRGVGVRERVDGSRA